ncbi:MAG: hypothetical protein EBW74_02400 [Betaproteobacteria bacterium]|nr:hypothetical protein [Betaproteobacteria bacterium]
MTSELDPAERRTLITLSTGAFASQCSVRLCDPMLPQLAQDLGHFLGEVVYVITSFSIAYGLFQLLHGPMSDYAGKLRYGNRVLDLAKGKNSVEGWGWFRGGPRGALWFSS